MLCATLVNPVLHGVLLRHYAQMLRATPVREFYYIYKRLNVNGSLRSVKTAISSRIGVLLN